MAFTGNYTCNSFKSGLLSGDFDFDTPGDTIKMALYTNAATLDEDTAAYTAVGEVPDTGTYSAGGVTLTVEKGITNNTAFISFADATISVSTAFTARGALIYKAGGSNPAICVLDFGSDKTATTTFTVTFPTASSADALIRLS
jgi:hypothetical protein